MRYGFKNTDLYKQIKDAFKTKSLIIKNNSIRYGCLIRNLEKKYADFLTVKEDLLKSIMDNRKLSHKNQLDASDLSDKFLKKIGIKRNTEKYTDFLSYIKALNHYKFDRVKFDAEKKMCFAKISRLLHHINAPSKNIHVKNTTTLALMKILSYFRFPIAYLTNTFKQVKTFVKENMNISYDSSVGMNELDFFIDIMTKYCNFLRSKKML